MWFMHLPTIVTFLGDLPYLNCYNLDKINYERRHFVTNMVALPYEKTLRCSFLKGAEGKRDTVKITGVYYCIVNNC